jgi:hypothetical protein
MLLNEVNILVKLAKISGLVLCGEGDLLVAGGAAEMLPVSLEELNCILPL